MAGRNKELPGIAEKSDEMEVGEKGLKLPINHGRSKGREQQHLASCCCLEVKFQDLQQKRRKRPCDQRRDMRSGLENENQTVGSTREDEKEEV